MRDGARQWHPEVSGDPAFADPTSVTGIFISVETR